MKTVAALLIALASTLLSGCLGLGNQKIATYHKAGDRYLIEVYGARGHFSDDLKYERFEMSWSFDVPRIEGKIDGKEIRPKKGFLPYVGSITIRGKEMIVDLQADNYVYHKLERVDWNGRYTVVEKEPNQPSEPTRGKGP